MTYKHKTPILGIPFMAYDDVLSAQEERKKAIIIENQLLAAMKGIQSCVFEEGEYRVIDEGKTKSVYLMTTGQNLSFMGIVGGGFCKISGTLKWEGLQTGKKYYLYLKAKENIFENPTAIRTIAKQNIPFQPQQKATLLAVIDLTNKEKHLLDTLPPGKSYGHNVALHGSDNTNPHGCELEQDSILLKKEISFEHNGKDGKTKERISLYNEEGTGVLNKLLEEGTVKTQQITKENEEKTLITKLQSGGANGTEIKVQSAKKIKAVYVHENADETRPSFLLGQIATKISGQILRIYNDGSLGINMRVVIIYE